MKIIPPNKGDLCRVIMAGTKDKLGDTLWVVVKQHKFHCMIRPYGTKDAPQVFDTSMLCRVDNPAERRWDGIAYEARRRWLERSGHAQGWAGHAWEELNDEIRTDLAAVS